MPDEKKTKEITDAYRFRWIAAVAQAIPIMFHRHALTARVDEFSRAIYWMATMPDDYIIRNPQIFDEIEYHASEVVKYSVMPR